MIPLLLLAGGALLIGKYAHHVLGSNDLGTMSAEWLLEYRRQAQTIS